MSAFEYRALPKFVTDDTDKLKTSLFSKTWLAFDTDVTTKVFDLSSAQPETVNFFSGHNCYLTIADCTDDLINPSQLEHVLDEENNPPSFDSTLSRHISTCYGPYDVILIWDIVNYLDSREINAFANHLLKLCHKATRVHCFVYTGTVKPTKPGQYKIHNDDQMSCVEQTDELIKNIPISSTALKKYMSHFEIERSMLLKNGIQETLLKPIAFGGKI